MPESLWSEAVSLAGVVGVSPVARFLDIGHKSLKQRLSVGKCGAVEPAGEGRPVAFVELMVAGRTAPAVTPASAASSSGAVVIELTNWDGAQMLVRLGAESPVDVVGLCEAFWRRGR